MALYRDIMTNDELLNSYFDTKEVDNCVYEAEGRHITKTDQVDFNIGANKSAEEGGDDEGYDAAGATQVIDVVDNFRLNKMDGLFADKKQFAEYMKGWFPKVKAKLTEIGKDEAEVEAIMKGVKGFCGKVAKDFKNWDFYLGESMDVGVGSLVFCHWAPGKSGDEAPIFYIFSKLVTTQKI